MPPCPLIWRPPRLDMARRFHDGATLWVISPQWEPHAHHVAVEFVHPVIMGKRALPSVALSTRIPWRRRGWRAGQATC